MKYLVMLTKSTAFGDETDCEYIECAKSCDTLPDAQTFVEEYKFSAYDVNIFIVMGRFNEKWYTNDKIKK